MNKNNGGFKLEGWGVIGLLALLGVGGVVFFQSKVTTINPSNTGSGSQTVNNGSGSVNNGSGGINAPAAPAASPTK